MRGSACSSDALEPVAARFPAARRLFVRRPEDDGAATQAPATSARQLSGEQGQPPPPATSGALAQVSDGPQARKRLGYVNEAALARAELPFSARAVRARVLGAGATVQRDGGIVSVGVERAAADRLADTEPKTSAITPRAQSAVQSCLGDTLAQTILGPGHDGRRRGARRRPRRERRRARRASSCAICGAPKLHPPHPRDREDARAALRRRCRP